MPWLCFPIRWPFAVPAPPVLHALPVPPTYYGIGHHVRHRLRRWGMSHGGAVAAWRTGMTCVWVGAPIAAGGAGWALAPYLPGIAAGLLPGAGTVSPDVVVAVPEPGSLVVLGLAVAVLALVRR